MEKKFCPGDVIPESGVYRVYHDSHRLMHEATLLGGGRFPRCKTCKARVYFLLIRPVKEQEVIGGRSHVVLESVDEMSTIAS